MAVADGMVICSASFNVMAAAIADGGNSGRAIDAVAILLCKIRKGVDSVAS